jgi:hypothetical protein
MEPEVERHAYKTERRLLSCVWLILSAFCIPVYLMKVEKSKTIPVTDRGGL